MLTNADVERFNREGYLVIEDIIDERTLAAVRKEYADLMDRLYAGWHAEGLIETPAEGLSFWEKLDHCYRGGFDWYQPMDISLPHSGIDADTPMHIGPAVFDLMTHKKIIDTVECLIGPEITSNPIQHVRIKPPARALPSSEI
ncbi:MAG: phytanoyl-CoA dioxygenase family protein, partial [Geminicoccaceae bacterium]